MTAKLPPTDRYLEHRQPVPALLQRDMNCRNADDAYAAGYEAAKDVPR